MTHNIQWDTADKTVVLQEYLDSVSKADLYQLAEKSAHMLSTVHHTVHLIIDERNSNFSLNSFDMDHLEALRPNNQGVVVLIVPPIKLEYKRTVQRLGRCIAPNAFGQTYFVHSVEQARQLLQDSFNVNYSIRGI